MKFETPTMCLSSSRRPIQNTLQPDKPRVSRATVTVHQAFEHWIRSGYLGKGSKAKRSLIEVDVPSGIFLPSTWAARVPLMGGTDASPSRCACGASMLHPIPCPEFCVGMVSMTMAGVLGGPPVTPIVCAWTRLRHHGPLADMVCAWNGCGLERLTFHRLAGFTITMSGTSPRKLLGLTQHHSDEGHTQGVLSDLSNSYSNPCSILICAVSSAYMCSRENLLR